MIKKYQSNITLTLLFTILILYLINSKLIITEFLNYTNLFITKLFPSTFIIYLFTNIFIEYNIINAIKPIFKEKTAIYFIIIMSILGGFPSGPKLIKDLYYKKEITQETANYLINFTHFPNPLFLLGTISKLVSNKELIYIIISIYLSNLIVSIIIRKPNTINQVTTISPPKNFSSILEKSITYSLKINLLIYGSSIFFYLIATLLTNSINLSLNNYIIINSIFDLTKAISLAPLINNQIIRSLFIITIISISTINIHIQIKSILSDTQIKYTNFLKGRILSTIISIIIYLIIRNL